MIGIPPVADLPGPVRDLAIRLGATAHRAGSIVILQQRGTMRSAPDARPMQFTARQTISTEAVEFEWRAKCGPFGALSVADYLRADSWGVRVRLLGLIPFATSVDNLPAMKGETMRYLAELPWAPDAILSNSRLAWRVINAHSFAVTSRDGVGEVILRLSPDGLVAAIEASDRPRIESGVTVERPWQGVFTDYQRFEGRTVPTHASVSWILPTGAFKTWEGQVVNWSLR